MHYIRLHYRETEQRERDNWINKQDLSLIIKVISINNSVYFFSISTKNGYKIKRLEIDWVTIMLS